MDPPPSTSSSNMGRSRVNHGPYAPRYHPAGMYMTIPDLLRSSNLTGPEIMRVEDALKQRERTIDERDDTIRALTQGLNKGRDDFQRATDKLEDSNVAMDKLQSAHHDLQGMKGLQDGLLNMGRRIIEEKSTENKELRTQLAERDSTISVLNDSIIRIGMASAEEAVVMANEVSALRSLKMIEGYQKTITDREEVTEQYKERFRVLNARLVNAEQAAKRADLAANYASKPAAEAREIANEQQVLIEKLLREGSS